MSIRVLKSIMLASLLGGAIGTRVPLFAADGTPSGVTTSPAPAPQQLASPTTVFTEVQSVVQPLVRREPIGNYALAWSDEFNGDALDASKWECRTDSKYWSVSKETNVTVSGGFLHLALKKEKNGKTDYTSGGVVSKRGFRYGFYEASVKCPPGKGWHTSIFLTAYKSEVTGGKQELDVFTTDSVDLKSFSTAIHQWKPVHRVFDAKTGIKVPDLSQDFHVLGCEFTPKRAKYFVDGELVASFDASEIVHDEQSIWITSFAAPLPLRKTMHVDDDKLPAEVTVDWVRFYEKTK